MSAERVHSVGRPDRTAALVALFSLWFAGCVTVDPSQDFARAAALIEKSTGREEMVPPNLAAPIHDEIERAFEVGMTLDDAMRYAILNNRRLHAHFQQIGIARADLVQSGLMRNPALSLAALFPISGGRAQLEGSIVQAMSDLWQIPLRKEIAAHQLDETILRAARAAGELVADVRAAYHRAAAAEEIAEVTKENLRLRQQAAAAAQHRFDAGEADRIDIGLARSESARAEAALALARFEAGSAKRELARLLTVSIPAERMNLAAEQPVRMTLRGDVEQMIAYALEHRLDVRAARAAVEAADRRIAAARRGRLPGLGLGIAAERPEVSGPTQIGPAIEVSVPIFDQGQARMAGAAYEYAELINLRDALACEAANDVRAAADALHVAASTFAIYSDTILIETQQAVELSLEAYHAGEADLLTLLESQGLLLEARREFVQVKLAWRIAEADLERAVGASVDSLFD